MKSRFQDAYEGSPLWVQDLMVSGYGAKLLAQRYRRTYFAKRNELRGRDETDANGLEREQLQRLQQFVSFAKQRSPYYKRLYRDIALSEIQSLADIRRLPVVTKEDLRVSIDDVYTIEKAKSVTAFTGGTTGKSLEVRYTPDDFQERMAYLDAFKERVGVDVFRSKKATFSGRQFTSGDGDGDTRLWRTNWSYRQRLYSTFDLTAQNLPFYIENLNTFKPQVINGFVSAIHEVALFVSRNQLTLSFQPQAIFTTSETLLPHHRELIESVFQAKVYNQYASAEGAPFITECTAAKLHFEIDTGVIEVDHDEDVSGALITSFTTHGTPLIRYAIGDEIVFSEAKSCDCGSSFPIVDRIDGRSVDFLFRPDGAKVSLSHLADVIKGLPNNVGAMQFVQNAVDRLTVNMVVESSTFDGSDEQSIRNELAFRFGPLMSFDFEYVDEIPREASGKLALIKNHVGDVR